MDHCKHFGVLFVKIGPLLVKFWVACISASLQTLEYKKFRLIIRLKVISLSMETAVYTKVACLSGPLPICLFR